ncbi:MAG: alpha/beta fold hydrolase [Gammaproteobacteria bacterium]|nr:alpha/beta fold hydrolase [Gammaproteobacteria bacterium]
MKEAHLPNGIRLMYEEMGEAGAPTIIAILGITDNVTDWPNSLASPLIKAGFRVIRYELRDSGHSSHCGDDRPLDVSDFQPALLEGRLPEAPYTLYDMVDDLMGLMDHVQLETAALVGYSYGGAIAQLAALRYPDRVRQLVCLQSTNYNPNLSSRSVDVAAAMAGACRTYASRDEIIGAMTSLRLATNGTTFFMKEDEARASATTSVDRTYYPAGTARMVLSRFSTEAWHDRTQNIERPTLILHGTDDPIFRPDHALDMANRIPGSTLRWLEGAGHNHPRALQQIIIEEILDFLA